MYSAQERARWYIVGMSDTEKRGRGRPTIYKPEYCEKIIEYFRTYQPFPMFEGFADSLDVSVQVLWVWKEKYPDFLDAYTCAQGIQAQKLVEGALGGRYNANFASLAAKNLAMRWSDKQSIEHSGEIRNAPLSASDAAKAAKVAEDAAKASEEAGEV